MIKYTTAKGTEDLEQILLLQRENLPAQLSEEEKTTQGFVTVTHDFDLLKRMNDVCPHIIAKDVDRVIGYALCMHPMFGDDIEVLRPMFKEITMAVKNMPLYQREQFNNFLVMGQVCIAKPFRGQGLFRSLYDYMKKKVIPPFGVIITEVDASNTRSMHAHYAIGFEKLATYASSGHHWELMSLK